jgi:hypothetical protein
MIFQNAVYISEVSAHFAHFWDFNEGEVFLDNAQDFNVDLCHTNGTFPVL